MMKSLKEIQQKMKTADGIKSIKEKHAELCSEPRCDKHGIGFGVDNRFAVFSANIAFSAYTGYYGSSACSTRSNGIDSNIASEALHRAISKHEDLILETMAELISEDAEKMVNDARAEIDEATNFLMSLDNQTEQ
jgi:hypothetical protein